MGLTGWVVRAAVDHLQSVGVGVGLGACGRRGVWGTWGVGVLGDRGRGRVRGRGRGRVGVGVGACVGVVVVGFSGVPPPSAISLSVRRFCASTFCAGERGNGRERSVRWGRECSIEASIIRMARRIISPAR